MWEYYACMRVWMCAVYTSTCVYLCSCEFICLVACCSDLDPIARAEPDTRRPGSDPDSYSQSANTPGDSKTDPWDDPEIRPVRAVKTERWFECKIASCYVSVYFVFFGFIIVRECLLLCCYSFIIVKWMYNLLFYYIDTFYYYRLSRVLVVCVYINLCNLITSFYVNNYVSCRY